MKQNRNYKIIVIFLFSISIFFSWNQNFFSYLKDFAVLIHELSHASAALLTGGDVYHILINENESGETIALPSNSKWSFIIIVSSGYLGSSLIGSFLLYRGFSKRLVRETLILLSIAIITLTLKYSQQSSFTSSTGLGWGILLLTFGIFNFSFNRLIIIFLGTVICMYSIYDLADFTKGIIHTDAGILSRWILKDANTKSIYVLGYLIACIWSFFSIALMIFSLKTSFKEDNLEKNSELIFKLSDREKRGKKVYS